MGRGCHLLTVASVFTASAVVTGSDGVPTSPMVDLDGTIAMQDNMMAGPETDDQEEDFFDYWQCRRNPTWATGGVDYDVCGDTTQWNGYNPRHDSLYDFSYLDVGVEQLVETCLHDKFNAAIEQKIWPSCFKNNTSAEECVSYPLGLGASFSHSKDGDLALMKNVFTEQDAFGLKALSDCVIETVGRDNEMFYEEREFYGETTEEELGLYTKAGGNYVTYLSGLLQIYLPGTAAAIFDAIVTAHEQLGWEETRRDTPAPNTLGLRTAEYLEYRKTGRLGLHVDGGSHYSISIALSEEDAYEGGYFRLESAHAMFKVPKLSAVVFFSDDMHGVMPITSGQRDVFVVELWDKDDLGPGQGRGYVEGDFDDEEEEAGNSSEDEVEEASDDEARQEL